MDVKWVISRKIKENHNKIKRKRRKAKGNEKRRKKNSNSKYVDFVNCMKEAYHVESLFSFSNFSFVAIVGIFVYKRTFFSLDKMWSEQVKRENLIGTHFLNENPGLGQQIITKFLFVAWLFFKSLTLRKRVHAQQSLCSLWIQWEGKAIGIDHEICFNYKIPSLVRRCTAETEFSESTIEKWNWCLLSL